MFGNLSSKICVKILPLVILNVVALGNGNFLNELRHDFAVPTIPDSNKFAKGEDRTTAINNGLVADEGVGVGEVFVPKTFPLSSQEPSCEQLRAMWIFSKRQSRAAEITNEIPTYRDPFTYNVWEPLYANSRAQGVLRMMARERTRSPVFGRVVSREPIIPQRASFELRPSNAGQAKLYGSELRPVNIPPQLLSSPPTASSRRSSKNRYMGSSTSSPAQNSAAVQGSFQKLKELIWTERAKELTQQRKTEELAARTAMLKEIANGKNIPAPYNAHHLEKPVDAIMMDENRSPDPTDNNYLNYDRMSIANRQIFDESNKNKDAGPRIVGGRTSTRRIGSRYGSYPSAKSTTRKLKETLDKTDIDKTVKQKFPTIEMNDGRPDHASIGISRTYPIRQSHFRERNRSLFKENFPREYFQRNTRKSSKSDLTENPRTPLTSIKYDSKTTASGLFSTNNDSTKNNNKKFYYFPNSKKYEYDLYDYDYN